MDLTLDDPRRHRLRGGLRGARPGAGRLGDDGHLERCRDLAPPVVLDVLRRYPPAPPGYGRAGELMRALDTALRSGTST